MLKIGALHRPARPAGVISDQRDLSEGASDAPTELKPANLLGPRRVEILERAAGTMLAKTMAMKKATIGLALLFSACEPRVEEARQDAVMMDLRLGVTKSPSSFVLVIDDTNAAPSEELRAKVVSALEGSIRSSLFGEWGACRDPAAACPVDLRLVLAQPSAEPGARMLGPATLPALRWSTKWATEPGLDGYMVGLRSMLEATVAPESALYRPLEAADDVLRLLLGLRAPGSEIEAALVADVASDEPWIELVLASARDDESPLAPDAYLWPDDLRWLVTSIAPGSIEAEACEHPAVLRGRLGEWASKASSMSLALPCDAQTSFDELFASLSGTGTRFLVPCTAYPIAVDPHGRAACRVFARRIDTDACETSRGWMDPEDADGIRRPRFEADERGHPMRVCEIVQHEGARLEACRTELSCADCGSGFCRTEIPELTHPPAYCSNRGGHPLDFRFTGEAAVGASELVLRCRLTSAE